MSTNGSVQFPYSCHSPFGELNHLEWSHAYSFGDTKGFATYRNQWMNWNADFPKLPKVYSVRPATFAEHSFPAEKTFQCFLFLTSLLKYYFSFNSYQLLIQIYHFALSILLSNSCPTSFRLRPFSRFFLVIHLKVPIARRFWSAHKIFS